MHSLLSALLVLALQRPYLVLQCPSGVATPYGINKTLVTPYDYVQHAFELVISVGTPFRERSKKKRDETYLLKIQAYV